MQKNRLRKMSVSYETSQKNFKMLNEDMVKLDRKFKYAGLRASIGLPQDEHERMKKMSCPHGSIRQVQPKKGSPSWKLQLKQKMLDTLKRSKS